MWIVSFTSRPLYSRGKSSEHPFISGQSGPQRWSNVLATTPDRIRGSVTWHAHVTWYSCVTWHEIQAHGFPLLTLVKPAQVCWKNARIFMEIIWLYMRPYLRKTEPRLPLWLTDNKQIIAVSFRSPHFRNVTHFYPEDGGNNSLQSVCTHPSDYLELSSTNTLYECSLPSILWTWSYKKQFLRDNVSPS